MAFEGLSEKLSGAFKRLRNKGKLSESDVKEAMREVRLALLEADVNYKVAKEFTNKVTERAIGSDVMESLTPAQMVIKIVNEELTELMGSETSRLEFSSHPPTVIMMCGLQGSGKTTHSGKLALMLKKQNHRPLLVACDVYRPAAIEQLRVNAQKQVVDFYEEGTNVSPVDIAKHAIDYASKNNKNVVILDTAGRLQIDENMMNELINIKKEVDVFQTILVVDAMTGQEAVNVASEFNEKVGVDGIILSKLDGDTRGGAALSTRAVTGKPILYVGMGEKLSDLEQFYPDRMANRILGMGDVLTLIDKAVEANKESDMAAEADMAARLKKGKFDFEMYLESMKQMRKLGGLGSILSMLPGGNKISADQLPDEKELARMEAIVLSMTPEERRNPKLMSPSRKKRIADGSGNDIAVVNRFIKNFEQSQKVMKQLGGMKKGKHSGFGNMMNMGRMLGGNNKFF